MKSDEERDKPHAALIKDQLRRSFQQKAEEEIPANLMSLIEQLREQDKLNEK